MKTYNEKKKKKKQWQIEGTKLLICFIGLNCFIVIKSGFDDLGIEIATFIWLNLKVKMY